MRFKGFRKLFADDFLVIAAWLMLLASDIVWQVKVGVLYWQYGVSAGTIPLSLEFLEAFQTFMPQIITWNVLFYCCLWSIKFSFLLFFRRLGTDIIAPKYWWFVTVLTACGLIACIGDIDYVCTLKDIMYIMSEFFLNSLRSFALIKYQREKQPNAQSHITSCSRTEPSTPTR